MTTNIGGRIPFSHYIYWQEEHNKIKGLWYENREGEREGV